MSPTSAGHRILLTGGRGLHSEEFSHYQELPAELEHKVVEASKKALARAELAIGVRGPVGEA